MTEHQDPETMLPLNRRDLLRRAVGRTLEDIERITSTRPADFTERGGAASLFFPSVSGPVQLEFSDGLIHALTVWPSGLSVLVHDEALGDDPYADRHRLSRTPQAPDWLRSLLGRTVLDVRVHLHRDEVPSEEPRQAAVSYVLDNGEELFYAVYVHGRMDGDELLRREDVIPAAVARTVSVTSGEVPR
ncbi:MULTISPECIES: hypothetical protein [unclassified Streptomyces]|uniref:hypothetical protein n=1 Tax=unclassified Streptomyces TaxID=2593676 RepID=UPI002E292F95|nr:hypothetical protein [Streptomyces sp. NBC_01439]